VEPVPEQAPEYATNYCLPCGTLCPCTYVWAEGLILSRDNQSDDQPLALDLNTNDVLLGTDDLDFDWTGGLRLGYGTRVCDCLSVELGYLGAYDLSASDGVELAGGLMLPGVLGVQVNNFFGADTADVEYESDLHSLEANLVCCSCCYDGGCGGRSWEWLAGLRFISFDEEFGITLIDPLESTTVYSVDTDNDLFGPQIGARTRHIRGRWNWEATGKAGMYVNHMEQHQAPIVDFPNFVFRTRRGGADTDVAFVSDLNFSIIYQLSRVWGLRTGYNLIWLEGVALAPDQLDFTNTLASGRGLDDDGGVLLHGVNIGLEARY
jgi:hypothetical protein